VEVPLVNRPAASNTGSQVRRHFSPLGYWRNPHPHLVERGAQQDGRKVGQELPQSPLYGYRRIYVVRNAMTPNSSAVVRIGSVWFREKNSDALLPNMRGPCFSESRVIRRARVRRRQASTPHSAVTQSSARRVTAAKWDRGVGAGGWRVG
jgi:hypothetical protein